MHDKKNKGVTRMQLSHDLWTNLNMHIMQKKIALLISYAKSVCNIYSSK